MSKKDDNKIGKYFEDKIVTPVLVTMASKYLMYVNKMKDSYTSGQITTTAPADYMVNYSRTPYLIECKASTVHYSLRSCLADAVSNQQVAHHRLWHRALSPSLFLFYSDQTALIEIWDGEDVVHFRDIGKPINVDPLHLIDQTELETTLMKVFR